jgi:uncharacterized Zn finger protein
VLDKLITKRALEAAAGGTAFQRGEEYFAVGAVGRLRAQEDKVFAKVEGTETYQVELWDEDGELAGDCSCPRAGDGYFCKHCVAVGLAWFNEHGSASLPADGTGKKPVKAKRRDPWKDIRQYLETQPAESLIEVLLDVAQRDDRLFQSLLLKAERTQGGGNAEKAFRRAIVDETKNSAYEEGVRLVRRIGGLMKAQNRLRVFGDYLAELRLQFKPKRNFMKLLDTVDRDFGPWR